MAAATETTTTVFDRLRPIFNDAMIKHINCESSLLDRIEELPEQYIGGGGMRDSSGNPIDAGFFFPVFLQRASNFGAIPDNGDLPSSDTPTKPKAAVGEAQMWGRFAYTVKAAARTRGKEGAWLELFQERATDLQESARECVDRQLVGNQVSVASAYRTGIMGDVTSIATATVTLTTKTAHQFRRGMRVIVGTEAEIVGLSGAADTNRTISDITGVDTIVLDAAGTVDSSDFIAMGDTGTDSNWGSGGEEMNGLAFGVSNTAGTFQEIASATHPGYLPVVRGTAGNEDPLTKADITSMFINIRLKSGKYADTIVAHDSFLIEVDDLFEADVRYEAQSFKGGFERDLMVWSNGKKNVPFLTNANVEVGVAYFLTSTDLKLGYTRKWGWLDDDGNVKHRIADKASFEAAWGCLMNLCWMARNSHGKLQGKSVDTTGMSAPD